MTSRFLNLPSDYYSPYDVSTCVSVDQDPLNGCAAVNCFHKYNGHRNYFNPAKLRCTPVPRCDSAKPQNPGALPTMVSGLFGLRSMLKEKSMIDDITANSNRSSLTEARQNGHCEM